MRFDCYMSHCLYNKHGGYYTQPNHKIGRKGDFFTSVSVGDVWGALLARQFHEIWEKLGRPQNFTICEAGAHNAQFAADVFTEWQRISSPLLTATHYILVEPLPNFIEAQKETLQPFLNEGCKISWIKTLANLSPSSITGIIFSNELIDSLPVRLIRYVEGKWREIYIGASQSGGNFYEVEAPVDKDILAEINRWQIPPIEGYTTEVHIEARHWIRETSKILKRGVIFTIDYGLNAHQYYDPTRYLGTLRCYSHHRQLTDPLENPGKQDITAHVNWCLLRDEALKCHLDEIAFCDQRHFLIALWPDYFSSFTVANPIRPKTLRAFQTLIHPEHMGRAFKFLIHAREFPQCHTIKGLNGPKG
jgi:SAM-dependent MidA family methyltransferase